MQSWKMLTMLNNLLRGANFSSGLGQKPNPLLFYRMSNRDEI